MTAVDVEVEQAHADKFPKEMDGGHVEQTEQEEPELAEVERQQAVPEDDGQRTVVELLADAGRYGVQRAVLAAQRLQQALKLRGDLLLLAGVVDVRLLEVTLGPAVGLGRHLVVQLLLPLRRIELAALLALEEEEVHLDVVVGQSLLASKSGKTRCNTQRIDHGRGNEGVLRRVGYAEPLELEVVVQVEAVDQQMVDGDEPRETSHAVEYAAQPALLARQAGQLAVGAVEHVGHHQEGDGDEVHRESPQAAVVETAAGEEAGTGGTDDHRPDGDGVGVDVELGQEYGQIVTEGADDVEVKPVFRLG